MTNNQWLYMVIPVTTIDITNSSNENHLFRAFEGLGEAFGHWAIRAIRWDLIHHGWATHHVAAALDVFLEDPGNCQMLASRLGWTANVQTSQGFRVKGLGLNGGLGYPSD